MDALLALIIALLGFALMIFMLSRSVKFIMAVGVCVILLFVLETFGFMEMISW